MKILEAQNALVSNYEVYQHLLEQQTLKKQEKKKLPGNLATLTREVLQYLTTAPSPLQAQETQHNYSPEAIAALMKRFREAGFQSELTKGELLSILNLRPSNSALLSTAIEDLEERFTEDEQAQIIDIVVEVLGQPPQEDDQGAMEVDDGA